MFRISNVRIGTKLMIMSMLSILLVGGMIFSQRSSNSSVREATDAANLEQQVGRDVLAAKGEVAGMQLAVRDVRLSRTSADLSNATKSLQERNKAFHAFVDPLTQRLRSPENRARAVKLRALADEYLTRTVNDIVSIRSEAIDLETKANPESAQRIASLNEQAVQIARTRTLPIAAELDKLSDQIIEHANGLVTEQLENSTQVMHAAERIGLMIGAVAILLLIGSAAIGTVSIARPLVALTEPINELADGNFNVTIAGVGRKDEVGQIATAVNAMAIRVHDTIAEIKQSAMEVNSASGEISTSTTDLSQRTEEQAASLEETTAAMEEISAAVKKSAENADQANKSAAQAREVADQGGQVVAQAVQAMAKIEDSSRKISDIIGVIDEIARQTNLLALNAAVEAARAGEAGRGFAVVASEVRSLAQRSSQAAKDIKELITNSNGQVQEGVDLVNHAGSALSKIVESVKDVAELVNDIAAASTEQATGLEQINKALMQMDEVTQQNAALVEENAATARALETQAQSMDEQVAFFKIDDRERAASKMRGPVEKAEPRSETVVQIATKSASAPKNQPVVALKHVAQGGRGGGPARQMQTALATAVNVEAEWKDF